MYHGFGPKQPGGSKRYRASLAADPIAFQTVFVFGLLSRTNGYRLLITDHSDGSIWTLSPPPDRTSATASSNWSSEKVWVTILPVSTAPASSRSIAGP
jgi:hypothetical protein